jgi:ribonuclease HII
MIIGIDEVGLGAWAGPLVVGAFAAPSEDWQVAGLNDSKKLNRVQRTKIAKQLLREYSGFQVLVEVPSNRIDERGISNVLPEAMAEALETLIQRVGIPERVIVDGAPPRSKRANRILGAEFHVKADSKFPCVMAASVLAKVARDQTMRSLSVTYPYYGFDRHVGYGTNRHREAIVEHGICPLHRQSYSPIRSFLSEDYGKTTNNSQQRG